MTRVERNLMLWLADFYAPRSFYLYRRGGQRVLVGLRPRDL